MHRLPRSVAGEFGGADWPSAVDEGWAEEGTAGSNAAPISVAKAEANGPVVCRRRGTVRGGP